MESPFFTLSFSPDILPFSISACSYLVILPDTFELHSNIRLQFKNFKVLWLVIDTAPNSQICQFELSGCFKSLKMVWCGKQSHSRFPSIYSIFYEWHSIFTAGSFIKRAFLQTWYIVPTRYCNIFLSWNAFLSFAVVKLLLCYSCRGIVINFYVFFGSISVSETSVKLKYFEKIWIFFFLSCLKPCLSLSFFRSRQPVYLLWFHFSHFDFELFCKIQIPDR